MTSLGSVVVVGSLNVDHVLELDRLPSTGETTLTRRYRRLGGGKGANQAAAAAQVGVSTCMVGCVGRDVEGKQVVDELARSGVDVSAIRATQDVATGAAFVLVDSRGANQVVVAPGANSMLAAAVVRSELDRLIAPDSRTVVLLSLEIPIEAVTAAAETARERGAVVILNPAPAARLPTRLTSLVDVLTPNEAEAVELLGGQVDRAGRLNWLALEHRSDCTLVVTLGDRGAALFGEGTSVAISAPKVTPVDTTGAGDVFNGVLAALVADRRPLKDAVSVAVRAASQATRFPGARIAAGVVDSVLSGGLKSGRPDASQPDVA